MSLIRITNGFPDLSDADFVERARFIAARMKEQPAFDKADPSPEQLEAAVAELEVLIEKAQTGNRMDVMVKKQKREVITEMLYLMSYFVLYASKGDRVVAASSGFTLAKGSSPAPPIVKPENLKVVHTGQVGELEVSVDAVHGAQSYVFQYTTDPALKEESFQSEVSTSRKFVFRNMTLGTRFFFRVGAVGPKGQIQYSDVLSRYAA